MANKHLQPDAELRIVLVGKTGAGKTSTMNTLLGRPDDTDCSASSDTTECKKETGVVNGQKLTVIDTPGVHNTKLTEDQVKKAIAQCMIYAAPGPHVFLYVMRPKRFRQEDNKAMEVIEKIFGPEFRDHTLVLYTRKDQRNMENLEEDLKTKFSGRYLSFNNTDESPDQVSELLEMIKKMVEKNEGKNYSNDTFKRAQEALEEEMKKAGKGSMTNESATDEVLFKATEQLLKCLIGEHWGGIILNFVDRVAEGVECRIK